MNRWLLPWLGLLLATIAMGCPLERAKKVGFFDRAMAKDTREQQIRDGCPQDQHWALPGEPSWQDDEWRCVPDLRCPVGQHPVIKASCSKEAPWDCIQECANGQK